ncbi:MAG: hypothetical protein HC811_00355 [Flammeovirgaceae bacterium]|nr:hypothetical protein [Flammeovirgaceae bacterium]
MNSGEAASIWLAQGGEATINSYEEGVPVSHKKFFRDALLHYKMENKFFVHAGILPHRPMDEQNESIFYGIAPWPTWRWILKEEELKSNSPVTKKSTLVIPPLTRLHIKPAMYG